MAGLCQPSGFGRSVFEKLFGQDYRIYRDVVNHESTQPALSLPNGNLHKFLSRL